MKKKKNKNLRKTFFGGAGLFFLGILGIFFHFNNRLSLNLSKLFPQETAFLAEVDLNNETFQELSNLFEKQDFLEIVDETLLQKFSMSFSEDFLPWVGKKWAWGYWKTEIWF